MIRTWDPYLAVVENQILLALGSRAMEPNRPLKNVRFNAKTIADEVRVPTDARLDFTPSTCARSSYGRISRRPRSDRSQLAIPINNLEPFRDEVFTPVPAELAGPDSDAIVDPYYGQVLPCGNLYRTARRLWPRFFGESSTRPRFQQRRLL